MDINDFLNLDDEEQSFLLLDEGEFIDSISTIEADYILFAFGSFFVELTLCPVMGTTLRISPFTSGKRIAKYSRTLATSNAPWA